MSDDSTSAEQESWHLMCFPFLALSERCQVGGWDLLPAKEAFNDVDWASDGFKEAAQAMLQAFRYGVGHYRPENPTLVARVGCGFTGAHPTNAERDALTAAIAFCALDGNSPRFRNGQAFGWAVAEHVDYWEFPVSAGDSYLGIPTGRRFKVLVGNNWGPDTPIVGPSTLTYIPCGLVKIDADLADVVHRALTAGTPAARRLLTAIRYFVDSWRNQAGIVGVADMASDLGAVAVSQQTAFEALLDNDCRPTSAKIVHGVTDLVSDLYADLDLDDPQQEPIVGMCLSMQHQSDYYSASDQFREWAKRFTSVRNKTVHEGDPLKPFKDLLPKQRMQELHETIEESDRVLRDAIRVAAVITCMTTSDG